MNPTTAVLLPLAAVWALAVVVPGPNFVAIVHAAVVHGRRGAVFTALGTLTGTAFWIATGLFGLHALFAILPFAGTAIRIAGAGYLIWTGIQMVRSGRSARGARGAGRVSSYRSGLATTLANPKSAALAASLLAVALPAGHDMSLTTRAFVALLVISGAWYLTLALIASTGTATRFFGRFGRAVTRTAGGIFVLFGVGLAIER